MQSNVTSLSGAKIPKGTLEHYREAWSMIPEGTKATLMAFGVSHPADLFWVRDVIYVGYVLSGKPMDLEVQEAYLEFRTAIIAVISENLGIVKPAPKGKVLSFRQRPRT